jgi:hypothetical protein
MEQNKKIDYLPEMLEKARARRPVMAGASGSKQQDWVEQLKKGDLTQ